jgi:hypothetical protein
MNLFGDPTNLQGGIAPIQGSSPVLQPAGNPQQPASYGPTPAPAVKAPVAPKPVAPRIGTAASVQVAHPDTQINSIFSPFIGSRPSASNPGTLEYYNKQTGQGFSNPNDLYNFASSLGAGVVGSFSQLHAPVNSAPTFGPQIQDTQLVTDPNQTIASNAGTAGLTPAEYLQLIQANTNLTPDQIAQIQQGLGIPDLANQTFTPPQQSSVDFYNQLYGSSGLSDVKSQIQALNAQVAQRQQDFLDAQGTINENPFLSEASRVGRVSRLNDKAQAEINNLLQQQQQAQTIYQNGLGEINNVVQAHTQDFTLNQQLNSQKLNYLLAQAEQQKTAVQAQNQQAAYQYLPAYLQAKAKAQSPTTVTAPSGATFYFDKNSGTFQQLTPAGGNYDVNPITGDVFSKNTGQNLGGSSSGAGSGSVSIPSNTLAYRNNNPGNLRFVGQPGATQGEGGFAKFATPEAGYQAYLSQVQLDASRGLTLGQFINKYAPPSENNTSQYLQQATTALGVSANTPLSQIDPNQLAAFQLKKESGTTLSAGSNTGSQVIESTAQGLVNGTINPNQLSPRQPGYLNILQRANQISLQQTGQPFDAAQSEQNYNAKQQALNQSATDFRTLQLANKTAIDHLDQLTSLSAAAARSDSPIVNDGILFTRAHVEGNANYTSYLSAINVVRGEVAKVLGGGTATVEALDEAKSILPDNLGHAALLDAIKNVKQLMASKITEYSKTNNVAQYGSGNTQPSAGGSANLSDLNFQF